MNDLSRICICVPTYKRKWPTILSAIRANDNLTFHLFVRRDDFEAGYYDEPQFKLDNIQFELLDNVHCIGETREAMLQYVITHNYEFCFMIDDTQYGLHDVSNSAQTLRTLLSHCLDRFDSEVYKDKAFAFIFSRKAFANKNHITYFLSQLCQTYILNCKICNDYDLHFKPMNIVGIEDLGFYYEAVRKGLVAISDSRYIRIGEVPSTKKTGGCHYGNENRAEKDVQFERASLLMKYLNDHHYPIVPLIKRVDSVLYPGTFYYKFDTTFARHNIENIIERKIEM